MGVTDNNQLKTAAEEMTVTAAAAAAAAAAVATAAAAAGVAVATALALERAMVTATRQCQQWRIDQK